MIELNAQQKEAVTHKKGPLLVFAGIGTGKTSVITYRIVHLIESGVSPSSILALTFTNKAAEEMKKRVANILPGFNPRELWISTFHSLCAKLLRIEAKKIGLNPNYTIYDEEDQLGIVKECITELGLKGKYRPGYVSEKISRLKDRLLDAESYEIYFSVLESEEEKKEFARIYKLYQTKLKNANALDFGDLILKAVFMLQHYPEIKEKYNKKFKYILVDEFQDTNKAQLMLLKLLWGKEKNICVVGDDDQAIYSWRGADKKNILEFPKYFKKVKIIKLEQNYRNTKNILEAASNLIKHNVDRVEKNLWTTKPAREDVKVFEAPDEDKEASIIAEQIEKLRNKFNLSDIAILYRTNSQSRKIENALKLRGIHYKIIGGIKFYNRKEVKDIISYLKLIVNPSDSYSLKRVINVPPRNLGKTTISLLEEFSRQTDKPLFEAMKNLDIIPLPEKKKKAIEKFRKMIEEFMKKKNKFGITKLTKYVISKSGYMRMLNEEASYKSEERKENIRELVNAISEFEEKKSENSLEDFLKETSLYTEADEPFKDNSVTLLTLHLAKGLEFPVVFICGVEEGLIPMRNKGNELEEERRLFYVGMTRAMERLYLLFARKRRKFGFTLTVKPSKFIKEARIPSSPREYIETNEFKIGEEVWHPVFGAGRVLDIHGKSESQKLLVFFKKAGIKKIALKYCLLKKGVR